MDGTAIELAKHMAQVGPLGLNEANVLSFVSLL